jgi:hypothetical protein
MTTNAAQEEIEAVARAISEVDNGEPFSDDFWKSWWGLKVGTRRTKRMAQAAIAALSAARADTGPHYEITACTRCGEPRSHPWHNNEGSNAGHAFQTGERASGGEDDALVKRLKELAISLRVNAEVLARENNTGDGWETRSQISKENTWEWSTAAFIDQAAARLSAAAAREKVAAIADIAAERQRQIEVEGWAPEHDDKHDAGELATAAVCYALASSGSQDFRRTVIERFWPWSREWWKPKDRRRNLVRAGALIVAEIERLDRATLRQAGG